MFCLSGSLPSGRASLGLKSVFLETTPHQATEASFLLPLSSPKTSFWTLWVSYTFPYYCLVSWLVRALSCVKVCLLSFSSAWIDVNPFQGIVDSQPCWHLGGQLCSKFPLFPFILCWFHLLFWCIWVVFLVKETKPEVLLEVLTNGASIPLERKRSMAYT